METKTTTRGWRRGHKEQRPMKRSPKRSLGKSQSGRDWQMNCDEDSEEPLWAGECCGDRLAAATLIVENTIPSVGSPREHQPLTPAKSSDSHSMTKQIAAPQGCRCGQANKVNCLPTFFACCAIDQRQQRPVRNSSRRPRSSRTIPLVFILATSSSSRLLATKHSKMLTMMLLAAVATLWLLLCSSFAVAVTAYAQRQQMAPAASGQQVLALATNDNQDQSKIFLEQRVQQITKRSSSAVPFDQVSSADLPAEFRGNLDDGDEMEAEEAPALEQSKLAKLCQQTSSVLASVLPAPFRGHKRSVLCQFFGQVPVGQNSRKQQQQPNIGGKQQQRQLAAAQNGVNLRDESGTIFAIAHQNSQQPKQSQHPITLLTASDGRHPIQIVLEQHQRQMLVQANAAAASSIKRANQQQQTLDLGGAASVLDYAYQQRVEPPASMRQPMDAKISKGSATKSSSGGSGSIKFSTPMTEASFKPMSVHQVPQHISTSGWRIFNHSLESPSTTTTQALPITQQQPTKTPPLASFKANAVTTSTISSVSNSTSESVGSTTTAKSLPLASASISELSHLYLRSHQTGKSLTSSVNLGELALASETSTTVGKLSARNGSTHISHSNSNKISGQSEQSRYRSVSIRSDENLLVLGKPPGFSQQQKPSAASMSSSGRQLTAAEQTKLASQVNIGKRSEELKSSTANAISSSSTSTLSRTTDDPLSDVRTIEVNAQSSNSFIADQQSPSLSLARAKSLTGSGPATATTSTTTSTTTQRPAADLHQVQKREELVVASINNLTRIAFGNQLRDTVKVINKLIDQQGDLFKANKAGSNGSLLAASATAESVRSSVVVSADKPAINGTGNSSANNGKPRKSSKSLMVATLTTGDRQSSANSKGIVAGQVGTVASKSARQKQILLSRQQQQQSLKSTKKPKKQQALTVTLKSSNQRQTTPSTTISTPTTTAYKSAKKQKTAQQLFSSQKIIAPPTTSDVVSAATATAYNKRKSSSASALRTGGELRRQQQQQLPGARSLVIEQRKTTGPTDFDLIPAATISNIHRDKAPSSQRKHSATLVMASLLQPATSRSYSTTTTTRPKSFPIIKAISAGAFSGASGGGTNSVAAPIGWPKSGQSATAATQFSWLLPDKSLYHSDLFGSSSSSTSVASPRNASTVTNATATNNIGWKRLIKGGGPSMISGGTTIGDGVPLGGKSAALVLNRLESKPGKSDKLDSLTTLKMSLAAHQQQVTTSTLEPFQPSFRSSTQSRWIPTSTVTRISPPATTVTEPSINGSGNRLAATTTTTPSTTTTLPTSMPTLTTTTFTTPAPSTLPTTTPGAQETQEGFSEFVATVTMPTTFREIPTQNDLNEVRATDSISRYTTHWNEANELLATTRRYAQQQPLPQIANTGEFFSAETIASWPERYQTMLAGQQGEAISSRTTPSFETTRRNGESYDETTSGTATTARHRFETSLPTTNRETTLTGVNLAIVTVLPANHKLSGINSESTLSQTTAADSTEAATFTNVAADSEATLAAATTKAAARMSETVQQVLPSASASYTLIGPYTDELLSTVPPTLPLTVDETQETASSEKIGVTNPVRFPHVIGDLLLANGDSIGAQQEATLSANKNSVPLRAPYLESDQTDTNHLQALNRPNVSRKLHGLLVPTTRSFVGPQNPLNQQRFNLSALKFLAQNLLSPSTTNYSIHTDLSPSAVQSNQFETDSPNSTQYDNNNSNNQTNTQRLLEMLSASLPSGYYDLMLNDSSTIFANKTDSSTGKTIFGRAGSLLNDLRHLEHRRAAALLAAIRYQVPSPLVRPWDLTSDVHSMIGSRFGGGAGHLNDRLDEGSYGSLNEEDQNYLRKSLMMSQAGDALKAVLHKQRVIPRQELEARLHGNHKQSQQQLTDGGNGVGVGVEEMMADRRPDSTSKKIDLTYSGGEPGEIYNNSMKDQNATDTAAGDDFDMANEDDSKQLRSGRNFTRTLLGKLLRASALRLPSNKTANRTQASDFDLIVLSGGPSTMRTNEGDLNDDNAENQYPRYIRLTDYQTSWNAEPADVRTESQTSKKHQLPSAAVAAKLRDISGRMKRPTNVINQSSEELDTDSKAGIESDKPHQTGKKTASSFDCTDRSAGFYPDTGTACQTFYHCSSTGHLLTFTCPQQTRFDEKSLKCGPWFEVPCDLGRIKPRRLF